MNKRANPTCNVQKGQVSKKQAKQVQNENQSQKPGILHTYTTACFSPLI